MLELSSRSDLNRPLCEQKSQAFFARKSQIWEMNRTRSKLRNSATAARRESTLKTTAGCSKHYASRKSRRRRRGSATVRPLQSSHIPIPLSALLFTAGREGRRTVSPSPYPGITGSMTLATEKGTRHAKRSERTWATSVSCDQLIIFHRTYFNHHLLLPPISSKINMGKAIANQQPSPNNSKRAVWDCGSSLYDSFELKSLEKQIDAAIASRTLSMPHCSNRRLYTPPPIPSRKTTSRISRSLHRLIRSVFGPRSSRRDCRQVRTGEEFHVAYHRSVALPTISEAQEFDGLSPEIRSLVRRTASERFAGVGSIGIY